MSDPSAAQSYTVVVGVDGSPMSRAALRWAVEEARARHGRVRAIHAWMSPYDWQMEVLYPVDEQKLREAAQEEVPSSVELRWRPGDQAASSSL